MLNVVNWIAVGLTLCLIGGLALAQDSDFAVALGWGFIGVGGLLAQVGVIGLGVLIGLRAHADSA